MICVLVVGVTESRVWNSIVKIEFDLGLGLCVVTTMICLSFGLKSHLYDIIRYDMYMSAALELYGLTS